jgi:hypothetical protein
LKKGIFSGSAMGKFCVAINCVDPFGMLCTKPKTPAWFFLFYSASLTKVGLTVLILFGCLALSQKRMLRFSFFIPHRLRKWD